jgi:hypothetical protein
MAQRLKNPPNQSVPPLGNGQSKPAALPVRFKYMNTNGFKLSVFQLNAILKHLDIAACQIPFDLDYVCLGNHEAGVLYFKGEIAVIGH